jgi:proteasome lid subunit RPN8/RPN11
MGQLRLRIVAHLHVSVVVHFRAVVGRNETYSLSPREPLRNFKVRFFIKRSAHQYNRNSRERTTLLEIEAKPWQTMVKHAERIYPHECCGAMLGRTVDGRKVVTEAVPLENSYAGEQHDRYELKPEDLLAADKAARDRGLGLIGIFHSHPDCAAYFSDTDLKNSCPWYSFVVLSIHNGKFDHANSFLPDLDQTSAEPEEMKWQES